MRITKKMVMDLDPCYSEEQIGKLADGRKWISHVTVSKLDIPLQDKIWLLVRLMTMEQQREFARRCALDVLHLWDAPPVVKQYLSTGDEELREAACAAARAASRDAARARDAAIDAAIDAVSDVTWAASCAAAWDAAWDAAIAAAWDAAIAAAWDADRDADRDAAIYITWAAARAAARAAAKDAAITKYLGWCVEYLDN